MMGRTPLASAKDICNGAYSPAGTFRVTVGKQGNCNRQRCSTRKIKT